MTLSPSSPARGFALRLALAAAGSGWRVAPLALPYALAAGLFAEAAALPRLAVPWRLVLVVGLGACLALGLFLGAHVAAARLLPSPPEAGRVAAARRALLEAGAALAVVLLAGLAAIGLADVVAAHLRPLVDTGWSWTLARYIAIATALAAAAAMIIAATAFVAAAAGREAGFAETAARLLGPQAPRLAGTLAAAIVAATAALVAGALLAAAAGAGPAMTGALAKAAGFLAALTVGAAGAAVLAAER